MQIKRSRSLSCVLLYYIFSGVYFLIHLRDAAHPFLTKRMDCALVLLGIIICVAGIIKSHDSHEFLINDLKCFAVCDMGSLFFQHLYGKEVPLFVMWTIIIIKILTAYSLIRCSLEIMTENYQKCENIKRWNKYVKKGFFFGVFIMISPAVLGCLYNMELENKYLYVIGYILFCYLYGLFILLPFWANPTCMRSGVGDDASKYDEKTVVYKELDKHNPLNGFNRFFTGLLSIVFDKELINKIVAGVVFAAALVIVIFGHNPAEKEPLQPRYYSGVTENKSGNLVDEQGNVVGKLPSIASAGISAKTDFYRDIFRENRIYNYSSKVGILAQEIGQNKLISGKNTLIFYSEVVEGFGICNLEGEVIVDPVGRNYIRMNDVKDSDICIFSENYELYVYNLDGRKISEIIRGGNFENFKNLDCFIYYYKGERDANDDYISYYRIVDYDGNVIADEISDYCVLGSYDEVLFEIKDNEFKINNGEYYILSNSEGQRILGEENGKYLSEDRRVNIVFFELLKKEGDKVIESTGWVDEGHRLYHIAIKRRKEIKNEYNHKKDVFINKETGKSVSVTYPPKDSSIYDERHVYDNCDFTASYVDVNFDGHSDIIISLGYDENGDEICCAYLFDITDEDNGGFRYVKSFEIIPNYSIDEEEKVIKGYYKDGPQKGIEYTYKYQDDGFIKIAEETKTGQE